MVRCSISGASVLGFGPIFIILWNILVKRQKIVPKEILAVIFAFVGVTLLITKGNFTSLSFSAMGIFWDSFLPESELLRQFSREERSRRSA